MPSRVPGPSKSLSEGDLNELLHPVAPPMQAPSGPSSPPDKLTLRPAGGGTDLGVTAAGKMNGSGPSSLGK